MDFVVYRFWMFFFRSLRAAEKLSSFSICTWVLLMAWSTVVWSLPINRPISGKDRSVIYRIRYMATCRGTTTSFVLAEPRIRSVVML